MIFDQNNFSENFSQCNYKHYVLDDDQLIELKDLYIELTRFFEESNISYFAIGGTLIGTVRNGGLLPFDDDIDIGILDKDVEKIEKYNNDNYYFEKTGFGYKIFKKNDDTKPKIFIDIMVFEIKNNMYKVINGNWGSESIKENELYPLLKMKYSDLDINVPNKYKEYLDRAFSEWDSKIKIQCGHFSDGNLCTYKKMGVPEEIDIGHDNNKYLCYSNFH